MKRSTAKWDVVRRAILNKTVQTLQTFIEYFNTDKEGQCLKISHISDPTLILRQIWRPCRDLTTLETLVSYGFLTILSKIGIWQSEQVLAHFCLENRNLFSNKKIIELAAGSSGFAGIMTGLYCEPSYVLITDGNSTAIEKLQDVLNLNVKEKDKQYNIETRQLLWSTDVELSSKFDVIIAADCLLLEQYHRDLVETLKNNLSREDGVVHLFAPSRGSSMYNFINRAEEYFNVKKTEYYKGNNIVDPDKEIIYHLELCFK